MQRNSDSEDDDIADLPIIIPKYNISEQKLKHLEKARARKAELALLKKDERTQDKEQKSSLAKGIKKIKDPASLEIVKKEVLKATNLRQPKKQLLEVTASPPPQPPAPPQVKQTKKKEPKIIVEESEPEVIIVKKPKKKIVIEESATETEPEIKPKSKSKRQPRAPVESESESEVEYRQPIRRQPLKPPTSYQLPPQPPKLPPQTPLGFKICF